MTVERRHYVIGGEIATGGMGRVLEARDLRLGRAVAIKELLPKNRDAARRFEREARITARLQHPAIINVYEAGVWPGGEPFYAMTRVAGRSLAEVVAERATLVQRMGLLPTVIAVADALAYAHSHYVIHRDLKPSNVLVGGFGETVVIDWGLAKDLSAPADAGMSLEMRAKPEETLSGSVVGTPAYMPPEQARGEPVDQRADVYALGALLYKVLSGSPPYVAKSSRDVLQQVLDGPPVPVDEREPGAPPDLVAIVGKAMARDPGNRYPTAAELAADLKRFETGQLVAAHNYTRRQLIVRWVQRHRVALAISAIALTVFAVFGTISVQQIIAEKERAESEQKKAELRRAILLEERGRTELLAGRADRALANFGGVVGGEASGPLAFMIAEAMRPFESQRAEIRAGQGDVLVAYHPAGTELATATSDGVIATWDAEGLPIRVIDRGHGKVRALLWSPDGSMLAVGGDDKVVRVWSRDGVGIRELVGHDGAINDLSFSPDGKWIVSASEDHTARRWKLDTGATFVIATYGSPVTVAQYSPRGTRVITGSRNGGAELWNSQAEKSPLRAHTDAILSARWSPVGEGTPELVLTTSADGTAQIWNPETGKAIADQIHHKGKIQDAAWRHDAERIITAGGDKVARVWHVPEPPGDGEVPKVARELTQLTHPGDVMKVRYSVDDHLIVTTDDHSARIWDDGGHPITMFEQSDTIVSVELSPDGSTLVTGGSDGTARIWELQRLTRARTELASRIHAIAVAPDGRVAAGTDDSRVWTWLPDASAVVMEEHLGRVLAIAFSADGKRLLSAGDDSKVIMWTLGTQQRLPLTVDDATVRAVGFGRDGSIIAGDDAGVLWIWSATGKEIVRVASSGSITALALGKDGAIATASATGIDVWTTRGARITRLRTTTPVLALAFDASGSRLAFATKSDVAIARFTGQSLSIELALDEVYSEVTTLAFAPDGSLLFTGGIDGVARVWDAAKGKQLATRNTGEPIDTLAVSTSELLWIGGTDGVARALDVHVQRDTSKLKDFIKRRVSWRLGDDDVVRRAK